MLRKMIFKTERGEEVTLPVTPKEYFVRVGVTVQTIDVYELGPYVVPTYETREPFTLVCQLPSSDRSYCVRYTDQASLLAWMKKQITEKVKMRFIVSDTAVNIPVYMTDMQYGEQDGTNDLYVTLTLQPYNTLSAPVVQTASSTAAATREATPQQTTATTYTVKSGDTLWAICRKFYGDGSLCYKLAAYNGIQNANLIYVGQVLKIPDAETLGATAAATASTASAPKTAATYTAKITMSGSFYGYASYSYIDQKTGKSAFGEVKAGTTLTVSKGSSVTVRWRSGPGCYCDKLTLDGRAQKPSGSCVQLNMTANHTVDLHWAR